MMHAYFVNEKKFTKRGVAASQISQLDGLLTVPV